MKIYTVTYVSYHDCYSLNKSFSSRKLAEEYVAKVGYGYINVYELEREIQSQLKFSVIVTDKLQYEVHCNNTDIAPNTICFTSTKSFCITLMATDFKEAKEKSRQKAATLFNLLKLSHLKLRPHKDYTVLDDGLVLEEEVPMNIYPEFTDYELKELDRFLNIDDKSYLNILFEEMFPNHIESLLSEDKWCKILREPQDSTFSFDENERQCLCTVKMSDKEKYVFVPYDKWNIAVKHIKNNYNNFKEEQDTITLYEENK